MTANPKRNLRQQNTGSSYESISVAGFATVACSQLDRDLTIHGMANVCDSAFLAERGIFTRAESARKSGTPRPGAHAL